MQAVSGQQKLNQPKESASEASRQGSPDSEVWTPLQNAIYHSDHATIRRLLNEIDEDKSGRVKK